MSFSNKEKLLLYWKSASKNSFLKYGAPFFLLVLGGAVCLKQFANIRYEYSKVKRNLKPEEIEGLMELKKAGEVTLETEYEKIKTLDLDNWTNKRGPRPWEESEEIHKQGEIIKKYLERVMFHSIISDDEDTLTQSQLTTKKIKLDTPCDAEVVHSSLSYSSFKAPPLVEYNSIDSYCEKKLGKTLLPSHNSDPKTISEISKIRSISSPIVLKSPDRSASNRTNRDFQPTYSFFCVEDLSLVKCVSRWTNPKVCPIGRVEFDTTSHQCYLHSILEKGSWQVLLDTSLLKEIPKLKTALQIFGCIEVTDEQPRIKVHFFRNLGSTDLNLFVSSYKMMQKHIPELLKVPISIISNGHISPGVVDTGVGCELNDTLDCYNLSIIDKCIDGENKHSTVSSNSTSAD